MNFFYKLLGFIAGFVVLVAGLHYFGIVQINMDKLNVQGTGDMLIDDLNSEGTIYDEVSTGSDLLSGGSADTMDTGVQNDAIVLSYPYDTGLAETGVVKQLGVNDKQKTIFVYKVKSGGQVAGVEAKREEYVESNKIDSTGEVEYVDADGVSLDFSVALTPGQIVFLETTVDAVINSDDATTTSTNNNGGSIMDTQMSKSVSCNVYNVFMKCVFEQGSESQTTFLADSYSAFFYAIADDTIETQEVKCKSALNLLNGNKSTYPSMCTNYLK